MSQEFKLLADDERPKRMVQDLAKNHRDKASFVQQKSAPFSESTFDSARS
ncbi:hypothetical protein [Allocoleopsis franciscana]|uniref:Uncharacterized protein n=1 Tax=Allocoleopsis franciscana PCC 7113 TaxID=1173027 RepID=K9WLN4_9CYAN|nr:hypothetical protein [Allocoleopsis franciscana]AFZ20452.1 hypothetical protein Mic7113_4780 [Allocoleopsis franciscana PCC 7113]